MNRRSFLSLLGVAPVAVAAAPSVVAGTGTLFNPVSPIQIKKPMRFKLQQSYDFKWSSDEFLPVTLATPEDLAAFRAANYVEAVIKMESSNARVIG